MSFWDKCANLLKIYWTHSGQRCQIYILPVPNNMSCRCPPSLKLHSVLLYGQSFSSYRSFLTTATNSPKWYGYTCSAMRQWPWRYLRNCHTACFGVPNVKANQLFAFTRCLGRFQLLELFISIISKIPIKLLLVLCSLVWTQPLPPQ